MLNVHVLFPGWVVLCIALTACQTSGRGKRCLWSEIWWVSALIFHDLHLSYISLSIYHSAPPLYLTCYTSYLSYSLYIFFFALLISVAHCTISMLLIDYKRLLIRAWQGELQGQRISLTRVMFARCMWQTDYSALPSSPHLPTTF